MTRTRFVASPLGRWAVVWWLVGVFLWALAVPVHAGPAIDPRRMSGIARPDPALAPGVVTVRCLLGGFDAPAVGTEVTLEIDGPDGATRRTATTDGVGRATFEGLEDFVGRKATARADLGGETVVSRPFALRADAGTRLLLVAGAGQGASPGHAAPDRVPAPGEPFDLEGRPPGTLVVGTLDLRKGQEGRAEGRVVTLRIRHPDGREETRTARSDAQGRATFEGLRPPEVPAEAELVVEAVIAEGGEPQRSQTFRMGETAKAVYLAEGFDAQAAHGARPATRPPVEPPRIDPALPAGTVRVAVEDGSGAPVPDLPVSVFKKDRAGNDEEIRGRTGPDGVARIEGVPVQEDALYFVGAVYGGGPYQSSFFRMEQTAGVRLGLRVFETTSDPAVVRSAVQFEILPREKDMAQVVQVYQAMVEGDRAYWPSSGVFRIEAPEGARSVTVLPSAGRFLEEREDAPFAVVSGPLPPGELVDLSIAYLLPHDGQVQLSWRPPFGVVQASVVLPEALELASPEVAGKAPPHPDPARPVRLYELGERPAGAEASFAVAGLPTRPRIWRNVALGGAAILLGGAMWGAMAGRRRDLRLELLAQRKALAERYLASSDPAERQQLLVAIDRISRTLADLGVPDASSTAASPAAPVRQAGDDASGPSAGAAVETGREGGDGEGGVATGDPSAAGSEGGASDGTGPEGTEGGTTTEP